MNNDISGNNINIIIDEFKEYILEHDNDDVLDKYYYRGSPHCMDDNAYQRVRTAIRNHFGIEDSRDVFMVGSGMLGFSIKPGPRFLKPFSDHSDIDMVVVSDHLFEDCRRQVSEYIDSKDFWEEKEKRDFLDRFIHGWIRPDLIPSRVQFKKDWWDYFRSLTQSGKYS